MDFIDILITIVLAIILGLLGTAIYQSMQPPNPADYTYTGDLLDFDVQSDAFGSVPTVKLYVTDNQTYIVPLHTSTIKKLRIGQPVYFYKETVKILINGVYY